MGLKGLAALFAVAVLAGAGAPPASAGPNLFVGLAEDAPKWEPERAFPPARDLGVRAVRVTLQWEPGQTNLPPARIAELDRVVAGAAGMRIVLAVYASAASRVPLNDTARGQFCEYARNALDRYQGINDVVIGNEPNLQAFWNPQFNADGTSAAPAAYGALLARCYDVLHEARPEVNVLGPATSSRGFDDPKGTSVISHSPLNFIRKLGEAYRASGRDRQLFDTLAQHMHGVTPGERPWRAHPGTRISQGDWDKLMQAHAEAFQGTAQPIPGECGAHRCVAIWYLEAGFQTVVDSTKASLYQNAENVPSVPDFAGGEPDFPPPSADSTAPDQATQLVDAIRLAYCQPYVAAFFNFLLRDEIDLRRWQSGVLWVDWTPKDSYPAFRQAIAEAHGRAVDCSKLKGGPPGLPATTAAPAVAGTATEGQTLSANAGGWRGWPPPTFRFQWQRCDAQGANCADIAGAASQTYLVGTGDVGARLRVVVTGTNSAGEASAASAATAVVAAGVPLLSVSDVSVAEGSSGTVQAAFAVSLSRASTQAVSVAYATSDGTATAPDYAAASGTVRFEPGQTAQTIVVAVAGDTLDEADETFLVQLSNATNAVVARAHATATIVDDDEPPVAIREPAGPVAPAPFVPPGPAPQPAPAPPPVERGPVRLPRRADTRAPRVQALAARGRQGRRLRLRYRVSDASGRTREQLWLYRGRRVIAAMRTRLRTTRAGAVYGFRWRAPRRGVKGLRFCVRAWDASGNASARSCAAARVVSRARA